ncbi:hypothetical protein DL89DRAFT_307260 [Linderina pennispora]|uniref:DUF4097 domain-containing protein n=1 Tax=Linderina pennispora TaxID=61395 RepID=A0A1Y1VY35_9FUNG|nr:uncharacterized protein DL89DRAFT_307260 [Linderina pennispora]ORX66202.1 hypothetical protein DL89DRAFT_307260 [Linderina pennispora]
MFEKKPSFGHDNKSAVPMETSAVAAAGPSAPPLSQMPQASELPPAYSEVDPNAPAGAQQPPPFVPGSQTDLKVDQKSSYEMVATKGFDFERPLFIHTTGVVKTDLLIEPDPNPDNQGTMFVSAEVSALQGKLEERAEFQVHLNEYNEYDFHVNVGWTFWNMLPVMCRIFVRAPSTIVRAHPGIRADITNGRFDIAALSNIGFTRLNLKTTNSSASVTNISGRDIQLATTNGSLRLSNVKSSEVLNLRTTNAKIELDQAVAPAITVATSNQGVSLSDVTADSLKVETKNSSIKSRNVRAGSVDMKTTNSSITTDGIRADSLHISTTNARVEGMWVVKSALDVYTTNSRISGTIQLADARAPAQIRFSTSNSKIEAFLPAESFRGIIDARTSNDKANVQLASQYAQPPELQHIVSDKSYKRVMVGNGPHGFSAKTSNSKIDVKLV